jgi:hypothetical protein
MISKITQNDLDLHKKWIVGDPDGVCLVTVAGPVTIDANLSGANLRGADLRGADLHDANLRGAYLHDANLSRANLHDADLSRAYLHDADLRGAYLSGADLRGANLHDANLRGANLHGANLHGANLRDADLRGAYLSGADLRGANLSGAKNVPDHVGAFTNILPDGEIIGWKKLERQAICKLRIPASARRSNATGRKCRAEFAEVLAIWDVNGEPVQERHSQHDVGFVYRVGETVQPDGWDEDRWNECSNGIHFFITRYEAENW